MSVHPKDLADAVRRCFYLHLTCPLPFKSSPRWCPGCPYFQVGALACGWRPEPGKKEVAYAPPSSCEILGLAQELEGARDQRDWDRVASLERGLRDLAAHIIDG